MIQSDTRLHLLFSAMFDEIPNRKPYKSDPSNQLSQVRDYEHMLQLLNHLMVTAPGWNDKSHKVGLVGLPIYALLDWPMGTSMGYAVFLDPRVNKMLKKILNEWASFLQSPESAYCLSSNEDGWFGPTGLQDLTAVANLTSAEPKAANQRPFEDIFQCDPSKKYHGFSSWDDFFTRLFYFDTPNDPRPVASPNDPLIVANACESTPYMLARNVSARDKFWLKSQPYSVLDMLDHENLAERFVGGTIYQAFLSALSYHRWHAPVGGKVVKTKVVDGTYYSEPLFTDFRKDDKGKQEAADVSGQGSAQGYLSAVATRALIFIDTGVEGLGKVCVIAIGMAEVSSCDITVKEGQEVKKGEQIGMFHFGGSTHCVLFEKGVEVDGFPDVGSAKENVPVRGKLCEVRLK
jgi:phosphatidylserine decarboxylase